VRQAKIEQERKTHEFAQEIKASAALDSRRLDERIDAHMETFLKKLQEVDKSFRMFNT
jgi:hypothetical protein